MTLSAGSETTERRASPLRAHTSLQDMMLSPLRGSSKKAFVGSSLPLSKHARSERFFSTKK